ncbi:Bgt-2853 [Blumeria graminis f. sp. tritici]|uniref:Bgt-2853 n=2 Tax=Blumeria graminis f. sp. tritici TaxID=62690 RepID=A0A061HF61_BLUGR|nr:hypothetical protein BGT96224_2853 [Blumeria graminis f. sp. tritici 96224]VCU40364.1 Bgt-2853 [Blumeria graminis f. sp. tritici]
MFSLPTVSPRNLSAPYTPYDSSPLANSPQRTAPSAIKNATKRGPLGYHVPKISLQSSSTSFLASSSNEQFREVKCSHISNRKINRPSTPFNSRQTKPNPLLSTRAGSSMRVEGREARRNLFFKKIKEATDEKRWRERKGGFCEGDEEILRSLWLAEKRRWKQQREKEALSWDCGKEFEEDEEGKDNYRNRSDVDISPPEESDEDLSEDQPTSNDAHDNHRGTPLAPRFETADDDIYDDIFMDLIREEEKPSRDSTWESKCGEDPNEMDLS